MIMIILGIAALAVFIQISIVLLTDYTQFKANEKLLSNFKLSKQQSKTLVVYFSRSGNTELMAYQIAEVKKAKILTIESPDYKVSYKGWVSAMLDARKTKAIISNQKIDLSAYDTIYIGAPIWLYSPAPPVFEFVRMNDFKGKKVILFNSLNSKFEQKYINDFAALVERNGGKFIKHIYVIRGRMTRQMNNSTFLQIVRSKINS